MAELPKPMHKDAPPKSFGVLKPVGHVIVAFARAEDRDAAARALRQRGFGDEDLPHEGHAWLVVRAANDARSAIVAEVARAHDAELADRYGTFVVEQMSNPTQPP